MEEDYIVINASTGEVAKGGLYITEEERERRRIAKENRLDKELKKRTGERFLFVKADNSFNDLPPEQMTRLIYLSTYSNYDGQLMTTERRPMTRKELSNIMGLSDRATASFWACVKDKYIESRDSGLYLLDAFNKGRLNKKNGVPYQQIWVEGVRELYKATPVRQHKQLGYIYKMLPYINIEYNIMCWNPFQKDLNELEPMTIQDFIGIIGYFESNTKRLMNLYKKITFKVNGQEQLFCNFINDPNYIIVNPNILYKGSNFDKVEVLGVFCKKI